MSRLEQIVARLPEATRVDVEKWGGHPTFRVRGKNFVFRSQVRTFRAVSLAQRAAKDGEVAVATMHRMKGLEPSRLLPT